MNPKEIFVIALNAEADHLAAHIIETLRTEMASAEAGCVPEVQPLQASLEPRFYGVGGNAMRASRAELICDGQNADFDEVYRAILERHPDVVLCIGENQFQRRLAGALKRHGQKHSGTFSNWEAAMLFVDLGSGKGMEMNQGDFDEVINPQDAEGLTMLVQRTARRVIALLKQRTKHFPLKAALAS